MLFDSLETWLSDLSEGGLFSCPSLQFLCIFSLSCIFPPGYDCPKILNGMVIVGILISCYNLRVNVFKFHYSLYLLHFSGFFFWCDYIVNFVIWFLAISGDGDIILVLDLFKYVISFENVNPKIIHAWILLICSWTYIVAVSLGSVCQS